MLLAGPAGALSLTLDGIKGPHAVNEVVNVTAGVALETGEKVTFQNFTLVLDAGKKKEKVLCVFDVNGSVVSGCQGIDVDVLSNNLTFSYGYAQGSGVVKYLIKINVSNSELSLGNNKFYLVAETLASGTLTSSRQDLVIKPATPKSR